MVEEVEVAAPSKKKSVADLLTETSQLISALMDRMDVQETKTEELRGQVEAHRMMLQREEKVEPGKVGLTKESYPGLFHKSVQQGASSWSLVTPKKDYCSPGIIVNKFVCPCYAGVPTWMPTPFLSEAIAREIV